MLMLVLITHYILCIHLTGPDPGSMMTEKIIVDEEDPDTGN